MAPPFGQKASTKPPPVARGEDRDLNQGLSRGGNRPPLVKPTLKRPSFKPPVRPPPSRSLDGTNAIPLGKIRTLPPKLPTTTSTEKRPPFHSLPSRPDWVDRPLRPSQQSDSPNAVEDLLGLEETDSYLPTVDVDMAGQTPGPSFAPPTNNAEAVLPPMKKRRVNEIGIISLQGDASIVNTTDMDITVAVQSDESILVKEEPAADPVQPTASADRSSVYSTSSRQDGSGSAVNKVDPASEDRKHSRSPPTTPHPQDTSHGTTFYRMRADCMWANPRHHDAREAWRRSVVEELTAQGRLALRTMIR